jgi:hypothetical protein
LATGGPQRPKLIVLDLAPQTGVDEKLASALTDSVTGEVGARGFFEVASSRDIQTLLGVQRQRQLVGCGDNGACMTELAGAIGARFVLSGQLAKLGDAYQLSLQMLDSQRAAPVSRSMHLAKDLDGLRAQLGYAVAEATGTPLPPQPSHLVPYGLVGGGGLAAVVGAVIGLHAVATKAQYEKELSIGAQTSGVLQPYGYYTQLSDQVKAEWVLASASLVLGAGLIATGLYLNPSEGTATKVALVPSGAGAALVATW